METSTVAPARRRIRVYVAGPYTHGDVARNVAAAMRAADALIRADAAPFVPHLSHFQHMAHPQPYEVWTALDFAWLETCEALLRLPRVDGNSNRLSHTACARRTL